jgi:acylphosphatase
VGPADPVRRRVIVHGRVQGVYFRSATDAEAAALGVAGWVRNRRDGCVEAVFEGTPQAVAGLVAFCRRGPRHARVERIEVLEEAPEGLHGFQVLGTER